MATQTQLRDGGFQVTKPIPALGIRPRDELVVDRDDAEYPLALSRATDLTPRELFAFPGDALRRYASLLGGQVVIYDVLKALPRVGARRGDTFFFHPADEPSVYLYRQFGVAALRKIPRHAVRPLPDPTGERDAGRER